VLQVGLLEQLADINAPAASGSSSEQQPQVAAVGGSGVRAVQLSAVLPVLEERQVAQMMLRLHQVTEVRVCRMVVHDEPPSLAAVLMLQRAC
jgi:hypothetical protein